MNSYNKKLEFLDWEFGVSEYPVEDTDPKPPQTGDDSRFLFWTALMAVSCITIVILLLGGKQKKKD